MNPGKTVVKRIEEQCARVERARAEFNFQSIVGQIPKGANVLDVGAWSCYLGEMLRDRMACDVLSVDVVDANKTDVPFQIFDGKTLPVESRSFDCVLLLYVLHHAADYESLLREASRVVRNGGRVLIAEDSVDGLWNRTLTVGFHVYLWLVTRMGCDGSFRTSAEWRERFAAAGFKVSQTIHLGHHLGHRLWPNNTLFVLEKAAQRAAAAAGTRS